MSQYFDRLDIIRNSLPWLQAEVDNFFRFLVIIQGKMQTTKFPSLSSPVTLIQLI